MANSFDTFKRTIQIGEQLFNLSYSDYHDAYLFSSQYYSDQSDHFIDHFHHHSDLSRGEYEFDLIRYFFIKAIEHRIASDLYANTSRGNVCDVFWSPFDISMEQYPTNLPKHLEDIVNSKQKDAYDLANAVINKLESDKTYFFGIEVLNALQFIGQTVGNQLSKNNLFYKGYPCSEMLTRNELNKTAGINLCKWLEDNGFVVKSANFTRDTYQNIVAFKDGKKIYLLLSTEVAPETPGFAQHDLDSLYNSALKEGAIPYYASVSLGSVNNTHFHDGVLLFDDQTRFRINAIGELELE